MEQFIINIEGKTGIKMKIIQNEPEIWRPLPGSYGEYFSIYGNKVAASQADQICVWQNGEIKYKEFFPGECGSYPVWQGSSIFWNNNRINIETGNVECIDIRTDDLFENSGISDPEANLNSGYRPIIFAWSPDAEIFLSSVEGSDRSGISHSRVVMLDKDGSLIRILWDGSDTAPKAAIINSKYIIVGTRNTSILDREGNFLTRLPVEQIPQRIHISENGELLFIQTYDSITIWKTGTWIQSGLIKGPWLNAALSPDGKMIYAIDFRGTLYGTIISDSSGPMKKITVSAPLATIDAGDEYLVASFAQGDPVRWALRVDIDSIIKNV